MNNLLELVAQRLGEDELVVEIDTEDKYIVRITLDGIGAGEDGVVAIQLGEVEVDSTSEYKYFSIFSVLAVGINNESMITAIDNINTINMDIINGSFGVVKEEGILYHKYVAKIAKNSDEAVATDYLYDVLIDVVATIDANYNEALEAVILQ